MGTRYTRIWLPAQQSCHAHYSYQGSHFSEVAATLTSLIKLYRCKIPGLLYSQNVGVLELVVQRVSRGTLRVFL